MRRIPGYAITACGSLLALVATVILFSRFDATFRDYSNRFGSLSDVEFAALNDRMDQLRLWSRVVVLGVFFPLDLATTVLAIRARVRGGGAVSLIVGILAALLAVVAALFLALAAAMPRATMIG